MIAQRCCRLTGGGKAAQLGRVSEGAMTGGRAELRGKTFGDDRIILDGGRFIECEFNGTTLIYFGGSIPEMDRCRLNGVNFSFEGPAKNTVELLRWLNSQRVIDGV